MKTLVMNEKLRNNLGDVLTKLLISQLLMVQKYYTWYESKAET